MRKSATLSAPVLEVERIGIVVFWCRLRFLDTFQDALALCWSGRSTSHCIYQHLQRSQRLLFRSHQCHANVRHTFVPATRWRNDCTRPAPPPPQVRAKSATLVLAPGPYRQADKTLRNNFRHHPSVSGILNTRSKIQARHAASSVQAGNLEADSIDSKR